MKPYPIKNLPKSWQEAVRFHGCGNHRDAVIVKVEKEFADRWWNGTGWYVYCAEYPEEGATFLGRRKPVTTNAKGEGNEND